MTQTVVLFRTDPETGDERGACERHFDTVVGYRSLVASDALVLARYSVLPFYIETQFDLAARGSRLLNTYTQHRYVADISNWYYDFADVTPQTWITPSDCPLNTPGSFVLKGETNSKKHLWKTHMFAETRANVGAVMSRLLDDTMISQQQIVLRQFEEFERLDTGTHGLPVTNEWRFFALNGEVLAGGFYWANFSEVAPGAETERAARLFAEVVAQRVGDKCPFVVIDVAHRTDGEWRLVELNDGQMSGLGLTDPDHLYAALRARL